MSGVGERQRRRQFDTNHQFFYNFIDNEGAMALAAARDNGVLTNLNLSRNKHTYVSVKLRSSS